MRKILYFFGFLLYYTKLYRFIIYLRRHSIKILVYHDVSDCPSPFIEGLGISIGNEMFRSHMCFLAKFYNVVDLESIFRQIETKERLPNRVAITFDDGYASFKTNAIPVLREHAFPSTMFLVGSVFLESQIMWKNALTYLNNRSAARTEETIVPDNRQQKEICLKVRGLADTLEIPGGKLYLDREDCMALSGEGVEFGNHSYTHYEFSFLEPEDIENEMTPWCVDMPTEMRFHQDWIALPFGRPLKNRVAVETAAKAKGIRCILFSNGLENSSSTSLYEIGRNHILSDKAHRIFTEMELLPLFRKVRKTLLGMFGPT